MIRLLAPLLTLLIIAGGYLLLWPIDADPVSWQPEPVRAPVADPVQELEWLLADELPGPAKLVPHFNNRIATGVSDGRILVFDPLSGEVKPKGQVDGRPRGLQTSSSSGFLIAEPDQGLIGARKHRAPAFTNGPADAPTRQVLDVLIDRDGVAWFVDASSRWPSTGAYTAIVEHRGDGRLLRYDDRDRSTHVALEGLHFPSGVALSHDGQSLLISELPKRRILRYWIAGARKGQQEVLLHGLPGYPMHISQGRGGRYWLAMLGPREPVIETLAPHAWLTGALLRLPPSLRPQPASRAMALAFDDRGQIQHYIDQEAPQDFGPASSVLEHQGQLLFASAWGHGVWHRPLPSTQRRP